MVARELLPEPPKELEGMELKVEFISSLAIAQRAVATGSIERLTGFVKELVEMGYENVRDKLDADQTVDEYGTLIGVPPRIVVPDDAVAEIRQEREAERQKQLELEQQAQQVATAKDLGEAVNAVGEEV